MLSPIPTRRQLAASCLAALLLAACESPSPTSPLTPTAAPRAQRGGGGGVISGGTPPAPAPIGPLTGTWSGTMSNDALTARYDVALTIVQSGTGFSGTFVQNSPFLDRPVTQDAAGATANGQVSLTLRPQKGKPSAQSTSYVGTLSADSTTITLRSAGGMNIVVRR